MPLAINVLGTVERVCWALQREHPADLRATGGELALLYQPRPPKQLSQALDLGRALFDVIKAKPMTRFV
jgi:4-hydroxy-3-polyprenylbenzoate decarboxylase